MKRIAALAALVWFACCGNLAAQTDPTRNITLVNPYAAGGPADLLARTVAEGGALTLPGIGKVGVRARPERQVRNPQTQEMMTKPADKVVKITIAKALKDSVNA